MSMEKTLDEVVAGKYDPKPYAKERYDRIAKKIKQDAAFAPYRAAIKAKDKTKALAELDKIEKDSPEFKAEVAAYKLPLLAELDPAKAAKLVSDNLKGAWKDDIGSLFNAAMMLGGPGAAKPNYDLAIKCIDRVVVLGKDQYPMVYDTAAGIYFRKGNQAKAVELEEKAIKLAEANKDYAQALPAFKANLEKYKKGKTN
jgi:tetratricopeptide (TPR) repeat protein